jgi:hypothetical protein
MNAPAEPWPYDRYVPTEFRAAALYRQLIDTERKRFAALCATGCGRESVQGYRDRLQKEWEQLDDRQ